MDRYFQCLIRRVSGEFNKRTIQPSIRTRYDFYDPFENTAVRPLQYPESQTSRSHVLANQKERGLSERKLQKRSEHKLSAIEPPEVSPEASLKRVGIDSISTSINYKNIKKLKSKPTISSDPIQTKTGNQEQRVEKNDTHMPLQNTELPITETVKQKIEPFGRRNSKELDAQTYLKTIATKSEKPSTAFDQLFRRTEEKTGDVERSMVKDTNAYVGSKRVEPIPRHSFTQIATSFSKRRFAPRAAKENRLSIGNLVVDVVPKSETFRRRSTSRVRKPEVQKQFKSKFNRQTANLSFGLGQM